MICIFGGAFDPPHKEHIRIAKEIKEEFGFANVVFLPSGNSPHKNLETPFDTRVEMLSAAINGSFPIDLTEGTFAERAYSYKVLPMLKEEYGEISFLIGGDSLFALDRWRCPDEILKICPLIVVPRGDDDLAALRRSAASYIARWSGRILISEKVRGESVSSSMIRAKRELELDIPEVEVGVREIIEGHALYRHYTSYVERVRSMLRETRWRHTCGVVLAGLKINERIGLPFEKVFLGCLLHDCMKHTDRINTGVPEDVIGTKVLHAFNGAEEARLAFKIEDEEILDAIRYHTTARGNMTTLDKLVYTADMVEELTRDFEGVERLREIAYHDLDEGFRLCLESCYRSLIERGIPIYHLTMDAYNAYCKKE